MRVPAGIGSSARLVDRAVGDPHNFRRADPGCDRNSPSPSIGLSPLRCRSATQQIASQTGPCLQVSCPMTHTPAEAERGLLTGEKWGLAAMDPPFRRSASPPGSGARDAL